MGLRANELGLGDVSAAVGDGGFALGRTLEAVVERLAKKPKIVRIGNNAAAADDEVPAYIAEGRCRVKAASIVVSATVTAHDTNYATLSLQNKGSDGTGTDEIASIQTTITAGTGDIAAFDAESMGAIDENYSALEPGDVVSFKIAHAAAGVDLDDLTLQLVVEPVVEDISA